MCPHLASVNAAIESVDTISRDERDLKHYQHVLQLISNEMSVYIFFASFFLIRPSVLVLYLLMIVYMYIQFIFSCPVQCTNGFSVTRLSLN